MYVLSTEGEIIYVVLTDYELIQLQINMDIEQLTIQRERAAEFWL